MVIRSGILTIFNLAGRPAFPHPGIWNYDILYLCFTMKIYLLLFSICLGFLPPAAGVFDPATAIQLERTSRARRGAASDDSAPEFRALILEIDDEEAIDALMQLGADIRWRRADLLVAYVPTDALDRLENVPGLIQASAHTCAVPAMDVSRRYIGADAVQSGTTDGISLTGEGVTVGFADLGFDPTHPAFSTVCRKALHVSPYIPEPDVAITAAERADFARQYASDEWHATHVGGIICGNPPGASQYRGVAPGASLVAATSGTLDDASVLCCVEEVIASAKEYGQPCVVNLSLGSTVGPHDGTTLFNRYLDLCADDAVIVLSAGNEGNGNMTARHRLSADEPELYTPIYPAHDPKLSHIDPGYVDVWCTDANPLRFRLHAYDRSTGRSVASTGWHGTDTEGGIGTIDLKSDEAFIPYLNLSADYGWEINRTNGRFNLALAITSDCTAGLPARYIPALEVSGPAGTDVDVHTQGVIIYPYGRETHATKDYSISDMACGFKVLSVGSVTVRKSVPTISGAVNDYTLPDEGVMSVYSAYAHLRDGRDLPSLCAPGTMIVAPISTAFMQVHPEMAGEMTHRDSDGAYYFGTQGTSMASPAVAGVCALWLQADPKLSAADIRRIALATASMDKADANDLRSGAGCIDAVAGLRMIRDEAGISEVIDSQIIVKVSHGTVSVTDIDGQPVPFMLHDLYGRRLDADTRLTGPVILTAGGRSSLIG